MTRRCLVLAALLVATLICGACTLEDRSGAVWACDTVGEFSGCSDTGVRIY